MSATGNEAEKVELVKAMYDQDRYSGKEPNWLWCRDYGQDLLRDINQLAHSGFVDPIAQDCFKRCFREIRRLRGL